MKVRVGVFKGERREHVGSTSAVDFGMRWWYGMRFF
jgi:hypothetical protein